MKPPQPRPTAPTCKHCGRTLATSIELHRAAGPAGIMRVSYRPCDCARAKGERQRAAARASWLGRLGLRLMLATAIPCAAFAALNYVEAALVCLSLWTVGAICRVLAFATQREARQGTRPTPRARPLPHVAPLPQTRDRPAGQ